jgi:HK97 family phage portal protein
MNILKSVKSFFSSKVRSFSLPWSTQTNSMSKSEALKEYKRYVYTIVNAISDDVAKIDFQITRTLKGGDTNVVTNHRFIKLMRRPNPDYTKRAFIKLHETYMGLCGESFWYIVRGETTKMAKYLTLLRPDLVDVVIEKDKTKNPLGLVSGYVYHNDGKTIPFDKKEIIHFKNANPNNPYRGIGPIEAAVEYVKTERLASEFTMNSINNAGRPSGILNIKGTIGQEEYDQIKKRFKTEYSGTSNAGKTMIIKGADQVDFVKLGMELSEVTMRELKEMSRDDIMIMYRTSKTMLGITDDVNRASAKEAKSVWFENVIIPRMDTLVDGLDGFIMDEFKSEDIELSYEDPSPKYLDVRSEEWSLGHNKWLTTNQIIRERNDFLGTDVEEVEGGDEIYQSIALVPMGTPKATPEKTPPKDNGKSLKKKDNCGHDHSKIKKSKLDINVRRKELSRKEFGEIFRAELFTRQKQWATKYQQGLNSILDEQKKEILSHNRKTYDDWKFDPKKYEGKYLELFQKLGVELFREQALVALNAAGDTETIFEIDSEVLNYIAERVKLFSGQFDEETLNYIDQSIGEGYQAGESISKLRKRIDSIFYDAKSTRSERVARTETIAHSNEAALEAYRQSPMVAGQEWSTESGACEFCQIMDGKVIGLQTNFFTVGETLETTDAEGNPISMVFDYTNVTHPPLHPNCQCSILPVSSDMMTKILKKNIKIKKVSSKTKKKVNK